MLKVSYCYNTALSYKGAANLARIVRYSRIKIDIVPIYH